MIVLKTSPNFVTFLLCWVLFDRFLWNAVYIDPLLTKLPRQLIEKKSTCLWKTLISQLTLKEKQTPRKFQRACLLSCFSCVRLFATQWPKTRQALFFPWFLQARTLECVAMPTSRDSSWPSNRTRVSSVSCTDRRVLYRYCCLGSPIIPTAAIEINGRM